MKKYLVSFAALAATVTAGLLTIVTSSKEAPQRTAQHTASPSSKVANPSHEVIAPVDRPSERATQHPPPQPTEQDSEIFAVEMEENIDALLEEQHVVESLFPDTPLGLTLQNHLLRAEGLGTDAQTTYEESLTHLRSQAGEAAQMLVNAYNEAPSTAYLSRWKLVDTLAEVGATNSLQQLSDIAQSPIGEERSNDLHSFSSRGEEQMIRRAAIRGIEQLAARGDDASTKTLLELASVDDPIVREAAVLAYLRTGDTVQRKTELVNVLADEDIWLLSLAQQSNILPVAHDRPEVDGATHQPTDAAIDDVDKQRRPENNRPPVGVLP